MSEEEAIKICKNIIRSINGETCFLGYSKEQDKEAIETLLEMYHKQKEALDSRYYHTMQNREVEIAVDKYWRDKIEKELLEPINKERQETYKEFMKKGKNDYHGVEGSVLQELNWVVGTIEELLGE